MTGKNEFMERLQVHERSWGDDQYAGRPSLAQVLDAKVVAFWRPAERKFQDRWIVTVHDNLHGIEAYFLKILTRAHIQTSDRRFVAAYRDKIKVRIKGVRIIFEDEGTP